MENQDIRELIKEGYILIDRLDISPNNREGAIIFTDNINNWSKNSLHILRVIGKDKDEIKILSINNPIAGLFDFEKLENKKSFEQNKSEIKNYILSILNILVKHKEDQNKENTIFYTEDKIYISQGKIIKDYSPRQKDNKKSKRMNLIGVLIKSNKLLTPKEIVKKINYRDCSELKKEVTEINKMTRKKLTLKYELIIHNKNIGYCINSSRYYFVNNKK
ncbi:MAG: hypothetical protein PHG95_03030 [Patescibacteria group bacterium]|nr:hypothetical protein [Patescibacteria group bacterium]